MIAGRATKLVLMLPEPLNRSTMVKPRLLILLNFHRALQYLDATSVVHWTTLLLVNYFLDCFHTYNQLGIFAEQNNHPPPLFFPFKFGVLAGLSKVAWLPAKMATYLVSIGWLLCLVFLCAWHFLIIKYA